MMRPPLSAAAPWIGWIAHQYRLNLRATAERDQELARCPVLNIFSFELLCGVEAGDTSECLLRSSAQRRDLRPGRGIRAPDRIKDLSRAVFLKSKIGNKLCNRTRIKITDRGEG